MEKKCAHFLASIRWAGLISARAGLSACGFCGCRRKISSAVTADDDDDDDEAESLQETKTTGSIDYLPLPCSLAQVVRVSSGEQKCNNVSSVCSLVCILPGSAGGLCSMRAAFCHFHSLKVSQFLESPISRVSFSHARVLEVKPSIFIEV